MLVLSGNRGPLHRIIIYNNIIIHNIALFPTHDNILITLN
jgi:hypothetical protein